MHGKAHSNRLWIGLTKLLLYDFIQTPGIDAESRERILSTLLGPNLYYEMSVHSRMLSRLTLDARRQDPRQHVFQAKVIKTHYLLPIKYFDRAIRLGSVSWTSHAYSLASHCDLSTLF